MGTNIGVKRVSYKVGLNGDFKTLNDAITFAIASGNLCNIIIEPGTYVENITINDKINLIGEGGQVVIDGVITINTNSTFNITFANIETTQEPILTGTSTNGILNINHCQFGAGINLNSKTLTLNLNTIKISSANQTLRNADNVALDIDSCVITRSGIVSQILFSTTKRLEVRNSNLIGGRVEHVSTTDLCRIHNTTMVAFNSACLVVNNTNTANELFNSTLERRGTTGFALDKANTGVLQVSSVGYRGDVTINPINLLGGVIDYYQPLKYPFYTVQTTNNVDTPIYTSPSLQSGINYIEFNVYAKSTATNRMVARCNATVNSNGTTANLIGTFTPDRTSSFAPAVTVKLVIVGNTYRIDVDGANGDTIDWTMEIEKIKRI